MIIYDLWQSGRKQNSALCRNCNFVQPFFMCYLGLYHWSPRDSEHPVWGSVAHLGAASVHSVTSQRAFLSKSVSSHSHVCLFTADTLSIANCCLSGILHIIATSTMSQHAAEETGLSWNCSALREVQLTTCFHLCVCNWVILQKEAQRTAVKGTTSHSLRVAAH